MERRVEIFGQSYRIKGDDPARIDEAAARLDRVMREVLGDPGQGLSTRGAVLAALNLSEMWLSSQNDTKKTINDLNQRMDELIAMLPG